MAERTLISLVSGQRMQNVIPLLQQDLTFEQIILVVSAAGDRHDPRFKKIAEDLEKALNQRVPCTLHPEPVDPMLPRSTRVLCEKIIEEQGGPAQVVVNFTGGTKPMFLGAYQAAAAAGAVMIYVDTETEQLFVYDQGDQGQPAPYTFALRPITVREYLRVHGREIDEKKTTILRLSETDVQLARIICQERPSSITAVWKLRGEVYRAPKTASGEKQVTIANKNWYRYRQLFAAMETAGLLHRTSDYLLFNAHAQEFFNSLWLEAYVFVALQDSGHFMDVVSRLQLAGVENDLDVVCTFHGKLGIIECKGSNFEGQPILNRLSALKGELAGTYGKTFFITSRRNSQLSDTFMNRAKGYGAYVIAMEELPQVERIIADALGRRDR